MADKNTAVEGTEKAKKTRKPSEPKPAFIVFQILDEAGNPVAFDKSRVNLISVTKSAAEALEIMDGGQYQHATYKAALVKGK